MIADEYGSLSDNTKMIPRTYSILKVGECRKDEAGVSGAAEIKSINTPLPALL